MAARETAREKQKNKTKKKTLTMAERSRDGSLLMPSYNVFFLFPISFFLS
jgi:hypothetical protein